MTLDEFKQCDLRVGKVVAAERVEGSEKLLRLQIDLGEYKESGMSALGVESVELGEPAEAHEPQLRQILSGIGKAYTPEEMLGKQVVIIANLEPRMMMGFESKGMLLAAGGVDGQPVILTLGKDVTPGMAVT